MLCNSSFYSRFVLTCTLTNNVHAYSNKQKEEGEFVGGTYWDYIF